MIIDPSPGTMDKPHITNHRRRFETELFERVIPFWERHSPDREHGGYFNCLDRDGSAYDTSKHVWLQARQVWMFSTLWLKVEPRPEWRAIAELGACFLRDHAIREDGRAWFSLTRTGKPLWMQRKIFSECFIIMAFAQYSRVSGDEAWMEEAERMFGRVLEWSRDLTLIGRPSYAGAPASQSLAVPMILLNVIEEMAGDAWTRYREQVDECIERMLSHVHGDRRLVFETVALDGSAIDSIEGRLLNPGHAIEAGWFLQHWAKRLGREDLSHTAIDMVRWSLDSGWDHEYGGIFYFLDSEGYSPTQLEWDMKLWWPHCEAMYACLLNWSVTRDPSDWEAFERVTRYAFSHFPDPAHGEWFGYLNRRGEPTHRFKGGPYKGCFHVPRALWLCWTLLSRLESEGQG